MTSLLARIAADLAAQLSAPEDVPAARNQLRQVRETLRRQEATVGRDRQWWRLRALEQHLLFLLLDYSAALPVAAEILETTTGTDLRERLLAEADVLRCCIETQPLETTRQYMEIVFAQPHYADHGLAGHLGHVTCGLLAERRGNQAQSRGYLVKAWQTWSEAWCEPVYLLDIVARCAIHAARRRSPRGVATWVQRAEKHYRGYVCDEFRLRLVRLLAQGLMPTSQHSLNSIRSEGSNALELLNGMAERAHYWEYTLTLLYLLARTGAVEVAAKWDCLLPIRRKFERQLWMADRDWFAACAAQNLPVPDFDQVPLPSPPTDRPPPNYAPPPTVRARLAAAYRTAGFAARAEDSRLKCTWRQALIADRLNRLEGSS